MVVSGEPCSSTAAHSRHHGRVTPSSTADPQRPLEPLWRGLNLARGAYVKALGNTPGHVNHWSKRSFVSLLGRHGEVVEARSPFPWTMLLVRL